jgi:TfoX/Sxy family transcriptional regulator of competence genes
MSTRQETADFLLEQLHPLQVTARKMFGEYALYCQGKVVAFVCDDQLFLKPTHAGRTFLKKVEEKPAYPGSKMYFWISGDLWDDAEWLCQLIDLTQKEVPFPRPKKKK